MLAQVVEEREAEDSLEDRLAGREGFERFRPAAVVLRAEHYRLPPHGRAGVRPEQLRQARRPEPPRLDLVEHAVGREVAEEPVERLFVSADSRRDLRDRHPLGRDDVGDAELGDDRQRLRLHEPEEEPEQLVWLRLSPRRRLVAYARHPANLVHRCRIVNTAEPCATPPSTCCGGAA
jgi:hypothetical protein